MYLPQPPTVNSGRYKLAVATGNAVDVDSPSWPQVGSIPPRDFRPCHPVTPDAVPTPLAPSGQWQWAPPQGLNDALSTSTPSPPVPTRAHNGVQSSPEDNAQRMRELEATRLHRDRLVCRRPRSPTTTGRETETEENVAGPSKALEELRAGWIDREHLLPSDNNGHRDAEGLARLALVLSLPVWYNEQPYGRAPPTSNESDT
ncbi:hypothetical protein DFH94DRAFT_679004 [Russula ochroleuca]|uniref:Uncharacterized protein n=1 Tax=Russula ochroleuca TaxID=152965 RepID=A0A9P5N4R0_9AGAM|nr:hypothetical protein DFH94DRAFT_679004 [Russula ochroleuca]